MGNLLNLTPKLSSGPQISARLKENEHNRSEDHFNSLPVKPTWRHKLLTSGPQRAANTCHISAAGFEVSPDESNNRFQDCNYLAFLRRGGRLFANYKSKKTWSPEPEDLWLNRKEIWAKISSGAPETNWFFKEDPHRRIEMVSVNERQDRLQLSVNVEQVEQVERLGGISPLKEHNSSKHQTPPGDAVMLRWSSVNPH